MTEDVTLPHASTLSPDSPESLAGLALPPRPPVVASNELDGFAEDVRVQLDVPVGLVSLVQHDLDRQAFPGLAGDLPAPYAEDRETPLTHSFCKYVVHDKRPLVIIDARSDARVQANPAVSALGVVAYAGYPLHDSDGTVVGSLCAIDHEARDWTEDELTRLETLAAACSEQLRSAPSVANPRPGRVPADVRSDVGQRSRLLLTLSEALAETLDVVDVARAVTDAATGHLGCLRAGVWLRQSEMPRELTGLPDGVTADPGLLCWVRHHDDGWQQAAAHERITLDDSTPVGLASLTSESMFLDSRAAQNAPYPHLAHSRQEGERRAFLPLISHGRLYGTLALVWPETGRITDEQRLTVGALASYTAQAMERACLRQSRTDALLALQRTLMPTLPHVDEVQLEARYLPASAEDQVGGDWYDALAPSPGCVEVMVGDVMGHDITAAASMGQFRTMLRVLAATIEDGPAAQVARLDRTIADLDVAGMATLVHGRLSRGVAGDPDAWEFVWSNAGHIPPVALLPDGTVTWLDPAPVDIFLGVMPDQPRHEHRATLPAGSTLVLLTDGLVERRGEVLGQGLERLGGALRRHGARDLTGMLDGILADLLGNRRDDDVAVLAVRLTPHETSSAQTPQG